MYSYLSPLGGTLGMLNPQIFRFFDSKAVNKRGIRNCDKSQPVLLKKKISFKRH